MFFIDRRYGKLIKKESINGAIIYSVEDAKGKTQQISFDTDVCPNANIGDEVFYIYNRKAFSEIKKGVILTSDLKQMTVLNARILNTFNKNFFTEFISFMLSGPAIILTTCYLTCGVVNMILNDLGIKHLDKTSVYLLIGFILIFSSSPVAILMKLFEKSSFRFSHLRKKRDKYFHPYKKENFSKKDIILNKKINHEQKEELISFVSNIEELPSTEKLEIINYIENSKKMNVGDIDILDIVQVCNKLKMQQNVKQLLLR